MGVHSSLTLKCMSSLSHVKSHQSNLKRWIQHETHETEVQENNPIIQSLG